MCCGSSELTALEMSVDGIMHKVQLKMDCLQTEGKHPEAKGPLDAGTPPLPRHAPKDLCYEDLAEYVGKSFRNLWCVNGSKSLASGDLRFCLHEELRFYKVTSHITCRTSES